MATKARAMTAIFQTKIRSDKIEGNRSGGCLIALLNYFKNIECSPLNNLTDTKCSHNMIICARFTNIYELCQ